MKRIIYQPSPEGTNVVRSIDIPVVAMFVTFGDEIIFVADVGLSPYAIILVTDGDKKTPTARVVSGVFSLVGTRRGRRRSRTRGRLCCRRSSF